MSSRIAAAKEAFLRRIEALQQEQQQQAKAAASAQERRQQQQKRRLPSPPTAAPPSKDAVAGDVKHNKNRGSKTSDQSPIVHRRPASDQSLAAERQRRANDADARDAARLAALARRRAALAEALARAHRLSALLAAWRGRAAEQRREVVVVGDEQQNGL